MSQALIRGFLQARALRFLDLSSNNLEKKSVEYLSQAISATTSPTVEAEAEAMSNEHEEGNESDDSEAEEKYGPIPRVSHRTLLKNSHLGGKDAPGTLQTLRLDDCNLRAASLDVLGKPVSVATQGDMLTHPMCQLKRFGDQISATSL
jgi:hypothetical protein